MLPQHSFGAALPCIGIEAFGAMLTSHPVRGRSYSPILVIILPLLDSDLACLASLGKSLLLGWHTATRRCAMEVINVRPWKMLQRLRIFKDLASTSEAFRSCCDLQPRCTTQTLDTNIVETNLATAFSSTNPAKSSSTASGLGRRRRLLRKPRGGGQWLHVLQAPQTPCRPHLVGRLLSEKAQCDHTRHPSLLLAPTNPSLASYAS